MRLYAAGWLLLIIWTDMGLVKHGGDYENKADCVVAWHDTLECFKKMLHNPKRVQYMTWGQPAGFCLEGELLTAPGVIFPMPKDESTCD